MRKMRALSVLLATALTVTSVAVTPSTSDAAKKIKLNSKKKTIAVGKSFTLKLKNGKKSGKVTWTMTKKKKKIVKLTKAVKKGNKASVKVTGLKKGKVKVVANYKVGKAKAKKYTCTVTVKKVADQTPAATATQGTVPAATSPAGSAAPSSSAGTSPSASATGTATDTPSEAPVATPTRTPKPPKTPSPTPTPKVTGGPVPTNEAGYFDILKESYVVLPESYDDGSKEITVKYNDDGSQTIDFTGVTGYKGCRWYFGTDADNQKNLNLTGLTYLVVEGINQTEGFGANDTYDLVSQFLDGVAKADHGGALEICSNNAFRFPIEMDLTDSALTNTDLSNVGAYEIYIPSKPDSTKVGPFTITGIKAFKDKAAYEAYKLASGVTPTPEPTAVPPIYGDYTFDFSDPNCYRAEQGGKAAYNAADKSLDINFGDYQGVVFLLPESAVNKYDRIEMVYTLTGGDTRAYVYDGAFNGKFGQNDPGAHEIALETSETDKTVTFGVEDGYVDNCVKGLKLFNWAGKGNATMKIKSLKYIQAPGGQTPPPTQAPTAVPTAEPTAVPTAEPTAVPTATPEGMLDLSKIEVTDGSTLAVNEDGSATITCNGKYTGGIKLALPEAPENKVYDSIDVAIEGNGGQIILNFKEGGDGLVHYNWGADLYSDTSFSSEDIANAGRTPSQIIFNNQEDGNVWTLKYVKVNFKDAPEPLKTQIFTVDGATTIKVYNTSKYGDFAIETSELDSIVDKYDTIWDMVEKTANKSAGSVEKYLVNGSVTYKATDAGKGVLTVVNNGKTFSGNVTANVIGDTATLTFKSNERDVKVTVKNADKNSADVVYNNKEYTVKASKSDDKYSIVADAEDDYVSVTKDGDKYTVEVAESRVEQYGVNIVGNKLDVTANLGVDGADVTKTVNDDGSVTFTKEGGFAGVYYSLPIELKNGQTAHVKVVYEAEGSGPNARVYLTAGADTGSKSNIVGPTAATVEGDVTANADATAFEIKTSSWNTNFTKLTIKAIYVD